jgi:site-specific DNA recombinase
LFRLERELSILNEETTPFKDYISNHVPMMENLLEFYQKSDGKSKKKILSCIFSEKIHFDENKVAAISLHKPIEVLLNASKVLQRSKKEKEVKSDLLPILAPLAGLLSNQFWDELRVCNTLSNLINRLLCCNLVLLGFD